MDKEKKIKVIIEVVDEDNKVIKESLWATELANNTCQLDNIPFYAFCYSCDDVVKIEKISDQYYVTDLIGPSGNSTVRLLFDHEEDLLQAKENFKSMDLESESSLSAKLLALNISKDRNYQEIRDTLENGENDGKWEYEEASISEKHQEDLI